MRTLHVEMVHFSHIVLDFRGPSIAICLTFQDCRECCFPAKIQVQHGVHKFAFRENYLSWQV